MNFFLEVTTFLAPFGTRAIGEISVVILKIKKVEVTIQEVDRNAPETSQQCVESLYCFPRHICPIFEVSIQVKFC